MNRDQIIWNFSFTLVYLALVFASGAILFALGKFPERIGVFDFVILTLATFRLIRLFVYDYVFKYAHDYLAKFESGPRKTLSDLLSCPWCTGIWLGFFIPFFYFLTPLAWYPIFLLAISGAATYLQFIIIRVNRR